ncbi:MAG: type IV pilus assembly protein PilM [Candidatus Magasanikbacteria bacterium]
MFNSVPFPGAFGLDISDLSIKLIQLENISNIKDGPSFNLKNIRSISLPLGIIVNGEIIQEAQVIHYIQKLLQGNIATDKKIKSPWVVINLPESHTFTKLITLNKNINEIIQDDVEIEAQKYIPFTEKDGHYLDWEAIPSTTEPNKTKIIMAAAPKAITESYVALMEKSGLHLIAIDIESLSIARAMVTANKQYQNEARALLDIGGTKSNIIIYDNNTVQFSATLPFSGELLTTAIEQKFAISHEKAEQAKCQYGLKYQDQTKIWTVLMEQTKKFVEQIQKNIYFYYSHFPHTNIINHITMCGGSSILQDLDKVLTNELKIECKPGRVWKNLNSVKVIHIPYEESIKYATAIGLALRAADNPFTKSDSI